MPVEHLLTEEVPTATAIAMVLEQAGIDHAFGISGGHTGHIFTALSKKTDSIRTILWSAKNPWRASWPRSTVG